MMRTTIENIVKDGICRRLNEHPGTNVSPSQIKMGFFYETEIRNHAAAITAYLERYRAELKKHRYDRREQKDEPICSCGFTPDPESEEAYWDHVFEVLAAIE